MIDINRILCEEFKLKPFQVENTVKLIDEGNTIPFIARYRKEQTGSLDDVVLRDLFERLTYLRNLELRKEEVLRLIEEQGKLTEELKKEILNADVLQRVEDLYRPYRQKKSTRASKAKEKGLEPLAQIILAQDINQGDLDEIASPFIDEEKGVNNAKEAYEGACDIIAEMVSDNADYRKFIREAYINDAILISEAVDEEEKTVYEMYYKFEEPVKKIANHRVLAINRGEKEKKLKVKLNAPDERIISYLISKEITNENAITTDFYLAAIQDSYKRLIAPSIEREIRAMLTERAEDEAIKVFGKNTKNLLMVPPVKDVRVLAVDPSYRTGCKLAVLDETGKFLDQGVMYPNEPKNEVEESQKLMVDLINKYDIDVIAIGNGTASRETEMVVSDMLSKYTFPKKVHYTIVSEAGASVYSASKLAQEEYPDLDVTIRGAVSIGRRLQDPLAELVKIDPKSIGVGQYQHDVNQTKLSQELDGVVEDCVNSVGVDLNTASPSLLQYVSGITKTISKNLVKYREENGKFINRQELLKVKMLGEKAFEQCAGFLRISDGENPLDKTAVHPEAYEIAGKLLKKLGYTIEDLRSGTIRDINERIMKIPVKEDKKVTMTAKNVRLKGLEALSQISFKEDKKPAKEKINDRIKVLAEELNVGIPTLTDIIEELKKPGRDPRDEMPKVIFRSDVMDFDDMKVGMQLTGTVRNVVDFGAFVDIGVKQDGLVHLSEMSDKYIKNPMEVVQVGDTVNVTIISIDKERQRIGLSMKKAGAKMIDTVIFDFDGTLADTNNLIINSFKHIYCKYYDGKCDVDYILSTFGEPLEKTLKRDFRSFKYEDVLKSYREYQVGRFGREVTLYDTVAETIKYLHEKGTKLGIATSRIKASTVEALKNFDLDKYFKVIVTADDVTNHKPDKEPLIKAIQGLDSRIENTLYVGDSKYDIECALNAEVTPVLVGWQKHSDELVQKYRVEHVLGKMWDLTKII